MAQVKNIEELRKAQQKKQKDQRKARKRKNRFNALIALAIVVGAIILVVVGMHAYMRTDIPQILYTFVSRFRGGPGFPIESPGGSIKDLYYMGGDIAVLSSTHLNIYSPDARLQNNIQHGYKNPWVQVSNRQLVLYDRGGIGVSVYSGTRQLFKKSFDYQVYYADISRSGHVAVATGEARDMGSITVFDRSYDVSFKWYSSENLIAAIALSDSGSYLAAGCIDTVGGVWATTIFLFNHEKQTEIAKLVYGDTYVHSVKFKDDGMLHVITSKFVAVLDMDGREVSRHSFNNYQLSYYSDMSASGTVVLTGDLRQEGSMVMTSLDKSGTVLGAVDISHNINMVKSDSQYIYLMNGNMIQYYSWDLLNAGKCLSEEFTAFQPAPGGIYFVSQWEIWIENQ